MYFACFFKEYLKVHFYFVDINTKGMVVVTESLYMEIQAIDESRFVDKLNRCKKHLGN